MPVASGAHESQTAMELYPGVTTDPSVAHGQAVLAGTRIPVSVIMGYLAAGETQDTLMQEFDISPEQLLAVLGYAADLLAKERVYGFLVPD
jgi:uncharacterized protein (DUF433 family)